MIYRLLLSPGSRLFLDSLDSKERERLEKKLKKLKENPKLGKPMVARLAGLWSLRVGKHRAIYRIKSHDHLVVVVRIGRRKNVYGK